ncbi:MAG TPA: T9SS type A sorting domain-containing protein [bacterium]|nr:T9SS type A sorting domain-containing protein [bacterium]HPN43871.1 T9SS type A sorting domain-containing protein [bacterium]
MRNYPNPFNPATSITFTLPARARVALKIYDLLGKEVATLLDKELPAGNHTQTWNASDAPTGEYICRLQVNSVIDTCKLVLVR